MTKKSSIRTLLLCGVLALSAGCRQDGGDTGGNAGAGCVSLTWPEITQQAKPWTRWWWPASAVDKSDIDAMLDDYASAGLGGMEVTTIYGAKGYEDKYLEYLSPGWMDLFSHTLAAAGERGLGVDLANASGWPFGGNWVSPDYACRYLAVKTYKVSGGETFNEKMEYVEEAMVRTLGAPVRIEDMKYPIAANDKLQQHAFEQVRYPLSLPRIGVGAYGADGSYIDLSAMVDESGNLSWTAPEGDWTICAQYLGWHGKMVERAGPGGEGDVIDHFSGDAIERYLKKFDEAFKGYDVSGIRYYFNDSYEVDDARGNSDWTGDFFDEFLTRRGYDLRPHLMRLLGYDKSDTALNDRIVYDYRCVIDDLLREKYSVMWQQWAARQGKGIRNQAHGSPANIMDLYAVSDVPETEGRSIVGMKTASSAAHVCDKPLTSSESATWLDEHFKSTLGDVKTSVDTYLLSGVNHIFYHGTCMSPESAPWPGWLFYAAVHFQPTNPFWKDFGAFNSYVARCQSFLQAGKPDNDILLYFDATDLQSERGREQMLFHMSQHTPVQSAIGKSATYLYDKGYTWDFITERMICGNISVSGGKIVTAGGTRYETIILPECDKMEPATFNAILALAKKGATVMVENSLPADVPGYFEYEKRQDDLASLSGKLKFKEDCGLQVARFGKGRVILGTDLDAMLRYAGISCETMYASGLQCISRVKEDGGRYYFVKNASGKTVEGWIPIDTEAGDVGVFNPMTGDKGRAYIRAAASGKTEVWMRLLPDESILLETVDGSISDDYYRFFKPEGDVRGSLSSWNIRFVDGGPTIPAPRTVNMLCSWTLFGRNYENFSGTAEYTARLRPANPEAAAWELDLGDVRNSAAVYLDGKYVGTVFKKPYTVVLTNEQLAKGGTLTVSVSSSMENRISWMDRSGQQWRVFYNANIQARRPENRGADGYFTAAGWDIQDAGLLGPVTFRALSESRPE